MNMQLNPESDRPLHLQAEDMLRKMIQMDDYRNGKLLPNEVDLSRQMKISRNTLRQAINKLVFEGILTRKKGYGTMVSSQNVMSNARNWMSFSQEMKAMGCGRNMQRNFGSRLTSCWEQDIAVILLHMRRKRTDSFLPKQIKEH